MWGADAGGGGRGDPLLLSCRALWTSLDPLWWKVFRAQLVGWPWCVCVRADGIVLRADTSFLVWSSWLRDCHGYYEKLTRWLTGDLRDRNTCCTHTHTHTHSHSLFLTDTHTCMHTHTRTASSRHIITLASRGVRDRCQLIPQSCSPLFFFFWKTVSTSAPSLSFHISCRYAAANQARSPIGTMSARLPRALLSLCCEARQAGMTALGSASASVRIALCVCIYQFVSVTHVCEHVCVGVSMCVSGLASPCLPAEKPWVRCCHTVSCHSHSAAAVIWMVSRRVPLHSWDGLHSNSHSLESTVRSVLFKIKAPGRPADFRFVPEWDTCIRAR